MGNAFELRESKIYIQQNTTLQAICSEALWLVLQSPFERVPKLFRAYSKGLRSNPLPQCLLSGNQSFFRKIMHFNKSQSIKARITLQQNTIAFPIKPISLKKDLFLFYLKRMPTIPKASIQIRGNTGGRYFQ